MLKILFGCLLLVNAILLGAQMGWMDAVLSGSHEPQRLKNQINADKVRVTPPVGQNSPAPASSASPAPAAPPAPVPAAPTAPAPVSAAQPPAKVLACIEIGNLSLADGKRMESALSGLKLVQAPVRREIREESSHMVWIAPGPSGREGAQRKVEELKRMGINDFHVLNDNSPPAQRNGVSLGVFKTEDAARARLAALTEKGVKSARIVEYRMPLTRVAFQLRQVDAAGKDALAKVRAEFPRSEEKACEGAA